MTCDQWQISGDWSGVGKSEHLPTQISYCYYHLIVFYHSYIILILLIVILFIALRAAVPLNGNNRLQNNAMCMLVSDDII